MASRRKRIAQVLFDYAVWRLLDLVLSYVQSALAFDLFPTKLTWQTVVTLIVAVVIGYFVFRLLSDSEKPTRIESHIEHLEAKGKGELRVGVWNREGYKTLENKGFQMRARGLWTKITGGLPEEPKRKKATDNSPRFWNRVWSKLRGRFKRSSS